MLRRSTDDPILIALFDYWKRKCGAGEMPDRRDIDPTEIPAFVLPHVMMCDPLEGARRIRIRLMGTAIVERIGHDHTNRHLDEIMSGDYLDYVVGLHREAHHHRAPIYSESIFRWELERNVVTKRLFMPLTHGGTDPAITLGGQIFELFNLAVSTKLALSNVHRHEVRREVLKDGMSGAVTE